MSKIKTVLAVLVRREDTLLSEQPYRYLTVDEMKSLGDDSLPIDVRQDERQDSNRECMTVPPTAVDDTISPQHLKEAYSQFTTPDNIDITKHPLHIGFLVSFLVDARGGAMRGCRHSGVRVIVPPRRASMPVRVTCRYLKRDKLSHPPPLMEGEALASRILELGPVGAKFLGPVMIEVPHFGSLRGKEREIVILRSDNGETWREHTVDCSEEAVQDVLSHSFDKEDLNQLEENARTTRILTTDFPHYFAVVTRVRQEVHAIGPEGGMVSSSVVPQVQAVFPQGALTKKIKVGLQAQPISAELAAKLLGNRVAVSPIVTVEPRRRKFHKPITLTIPKPQAANKGMINQYSGDAPTLRLLCSITGGTTRAQWEDVTGSTPFTFVNDCVSFTTTVSARFWLMDCRNVGDATKMATELYREAIHVPFMAKFVVFAKRVDPLEARLRIFCMTDDKEDKTLEHQEHFTEVAKSRDVEVLEGKTQYVEFAGNLVPVTKSGEQLQLGFRAFRENRLPFTVRVKDPHADCVGRTLFMREARLPKGEPPQQPICVLNIVLPEEIIPEAILPEHELHKYSFIQDSSGLESYQRVDLRLSDISNLLGEDWPRLAEQLEVAPSHINRLKSEQPHSVAQQGLAMLRWWLSQAGNKAQASTLETALSRIGRDDIVQQCVFNVDQSGLQLLKEESRDASIRRTIPYSDKDIMKDSESIEDLSRDSSKKPGDVEKDDKEERKYEAEEKEVEEVKKSVSERRRDIEKRLSLEPIEKKTETIIVKDVLEKEEDLSEKEIAVEKRVSSPEEEPSELSFQQKRLSFEQGKRVIEMKPDNTTMKEVKERAEDSARLLAEERRIAEAVKENKSQVDETSIPFQEKRKSFEQGVKEDKSKDKSDAVRRDSALFEGVSQGLIHLDAAYTAAPQVQDLLSPKVSKTPPPSPAEFKDITGTVAWTDDSPAGIPSKPEQSQDWAGKGKPDSTIEPSKQRVPSDGTEEVIQSQVEDPSQISVTSKFPQQITETIDIKTTENKVVKDLEKDLKYQFTMVVTDKQTFNDTVNSVTEFLESEKNYNFEQNKLFVDRSVTLADTEVTSSDETDGSQSKSESEPKSDKSFVGKMSKKLFKVFKKDGKDKAAKKKGGKKKHKEEKADRIETSDENPNQPDDAKKFDLVNSDSKIVDKEVALNDIIAVEVADRKYTNISTEEEKQPVIFSGQVNHEKDVEQPENEDREQTLDSSFQISKEEMDNTERDVINLSNEDSIALAVEGGKDRENISAIAINYSDKEAKNKSENIPKGLFAVYPAEESKCVQLKEFESDSSSGIIEKVNTHKKDTVPEETPYVTKEKTSEKLSEGACKDVVKSVKDEVILNIKSLSDRAEESYLEKKDEVKTVTKSTIESAEQGTIYVTDKTFENVTDTSKKVLEPFEDAKDKSKSFFGGLFSKKKDEGKVDSLSTVIIVDDKSTKARKYGVDETFNKTSDAMKETNINSVDSTISNSGHSIGKVEESVSPDGLNGKTVSDYQSNKAVASDSSNTKINKEKKSFFGSLFGKGDTAADEGRPLGNIALTTSEIPDAGEDKNILGNKIISEKVEIVDGTVEVGKITKHVENNIISVYDGVTEDLNRSKIKVEDLTVDLTAPTFNTKGAGNEISKLATSNIEENLTSISEPITQTIEEIVPIVGETSGEVNTPCLNITDSAAKDGDKEVHVHGLKITQNADNKLVSVIGDLIKDKSEKIPFEDKTTNLDAVDSIIGTVYQKNDTPLIEIVERKAEPMIEEMTDKAKTAVLSKENNSGHDSSTIKIDSSVTFSEETSEPKKVVQETEKTEAPAFNPIQIMNIGQNILNDAKDNTSKAATYTKDKVVSSVTSLCEPLESFKQKNLKDDDDLCVSNMPKNTEETPKSITGAVHTEHVLANEKPSIIETNKSIIIDSLPSTTEIFSNITCRHPVEGKNTIKDDVLKIVEQSKEVKDKTVTLYDDALLDAADITDNTSSKIIDSFKSVDQKVKKIGEDTKTAKKDIVDKAENVLIQGQTKASNIVEATSTSIKTKITPALETITKDQKVKEIGEDTKTAKKDILDKAENLLIQGQTKASNIIEATSTSIQTKITPALETITKEIKHDHSGGKQTDNNVTSSIDDVSIDDKDKIGKTLTSIKTDLQFDASQDDSKIFPNVDHEQFIETDGTNKINDAENLSIAIKDGLIKFDTDLKSESIKIDDDVAIQNIKKILERSATESSANVVDELPATKGTVSGNHSIPHNIDVSLKIENDTTQPSDTYSFKPCVINETPLNDELLNKTESVNKTSERANTNDDKLNNILIDMLIEQECMKNSLSDISNQLYSETSKEMEEASSLPEKHDTEVSEKRKKSVTSSPFKTAASFGEVESLISEEELKRISDSECKESSSYVTTPTMQRRKIGGSQRLSREERPALRELTHMEYSSSDDDEANYIVTEPFDRVPKRTVTFQIDSEDEAYLKVSDSNSDPEIEVTEMTPSPDPTSKKQARVAVEEEAKRQDSQTKYNSDKNTQKVERRFERMASETLESDPAVKFTTDREFQRMVSQLSNEEVDACLSQWDEGGLTPSEELDSTKDTIEGDLDPELEALPEASLEPTNPFYSSSPEWSGFEHNMTNTPDSLFWAFDSTPTSAIIQPNELDIPIQSVHVTGESAGEEAKKSPGPATTREGDEALLDLAAGVQDKTQSAAGSGPSSAK